MARRLRSASITVRCVRVLPEVAAALADGRAVVALESTIISHGLPRPENLDIARRIEEQVRAHGAVPATIAVARGDVHIGLDDDALALVASGDDVAKASTRDLAPLAARGGSGATTVAATAHLAARAGIRLFATGGLGGVHREARDTWDESADLHAIARSPVTVVCAGVKSILDVAATLERLESLGVTVLGYRTHRFPGFYLTDSGEDVTWSVESPEEVASVLQARARVGTDAHGVVVAQPLPTDEQVDPALHARLLADGQAAATRDGVRGKDVTPYLLDFFHRESHGETLAANMRLILRNAALAAQIAVALERA